MKRYLAYLFQVSVNRPVGTVVVAIALTLSLFFPLGWSAWSAYKTFNRIIVNDFRLQYLVGSIIHLDEVLTMSARMNAATGDTRWEDRYSRFEPELDAAIKEAIAIAPEAYEGKGAEQTDIANQKLVAMEQQSFGMIRDGQQAAAENLLFSSRYEQQKAIYATGIQRGLEATQARIQHNQHEFAQQLILASAIAILSLLMLLPIWWIVLQVLQRYLQARKQAEQALRIAEENYRSIFENALKGIFQSSPKGHFISVNPALAKMYGYPSTKHLIASITDINKQIYVDQEKQQEFANLLKMEGKVKGFECRCYRKDSGIIWTQFDVRVVYNSSGDISYYEGIVQDITQRKQREASLKRQLEELQVEIDHNQRELQVATISSTDYFQQLMADADDLRNST